MPTITATLDISDADAELLRDDAAFYRRDVKDIADMALAYGMVDQLVRIRLRKWHTGTGPNPFPDVVPLNQPTRPAEEDDLPF